MMKNDVERRTSEAKQIGFEKWLEHPMARLGMAAIPPGERPDALRMLLQAAFEAGIDGGVAVVLAAFMEEMLKHPKGPFAPR